MYRDRMERTERTITPVFKGGPRDGEDVTGDKTLAKALPAKIQWPLNQSRNPSSGYALGPDGNYHWREHLRF